MKTVAQKLLVKSGMKLRVLSKPKNFTEIFGEHEASFLTDRSKELADFTLIFVRDRRELETLLPTSTDRLKPEGVVWVAYPKGTSKLKSDINRDSIREYGSTVNLDTVSIISMDDDWSCLRFKRLEATK